MPPAGLLLGLVAAVMVGAWLISGENPLDQLGDILVEFTTTEEHRLSQLEPETQQAARQLVQNMMDKYQIRVRIGQTLRSPAQEKAVIDAGKSGVKTHSWHELGRGLDGYPQRDGVDSSEDQDYRLMHAEAMTLGFHNIAYDGDPMTGPRHYIHNNVGKKIWDGGHLQYPGPYTTIAEAVAAEGSRYGIA